MGREKEGRLEDEEQGQGLIGKVWGNEGFAGRKETGEIEGQRESGVGREKREEVVEDGAQVSRG